MTDNVHEFPLIKVVNGHEAVLIAERLNAKCGVIVYDCPCGCGRVKVIEIGEPSTRDLLFYAENLRNHTMEEYCEAIEDSEAEGGEVS